MGSLRGTCGQPYWSVACAAGLSSTNRKSRLRLNTPMTSWTCLAPFSDIGSKTSWPPSVRSFKTKAASGLEFSDATTTAPVHATIPGNSLDMEIFPSSECSHFVLVLQESGARHKPHGDFFPIWTPAGMLTTYWVYWREIKNGIAKQDLEQA